MGLTRWESVDDNTYAMNTDTGVLVKLEDIDGKQVGITFIPGEWWNSVNGNFRKDDELLDDD